MVNYKPERGEQYNRLCASSPKIEAKTPKFEGLYPITGRDTVKLCSLIITFNSHISGTNTLFDYDFNPDKVRMMLHCDCGNLAENQCDRLSII
jgi:hypothetical protein